MRVPPSSIARWPLHRLLESLESGSSAWRFTLAIGAAAVAVAAYGYHWFTVGRFIESTDDAYVGGDITVIAPKVAGFIDQVAVTDNQRVEAGELLVKLDDRDYKAALARAEAAADAQRATLGEPRRHATASAGDHRAGSCGHHCRGRGGQSHSR